MVVVIDDQWCCKQFGAQLLGTYRLATEHVARRRPAPQPLPFLRKDITLWGYLSLLKEAARYIQKSSHFWTCTLLISPTIIIISSRLSLSNQLAETWVPTLEPVSLTTGSLLASGTLKGLQHVIFVCYLYHE